MQFGFSLLQLVHQLFFILLEADQILTVLYFNSLINILALDENVFAHSC